MKIADNITQLIGYRLQLFMPEMFSKERRMLLHSLNLSDN